MSTDTSMFVDTNDMNVLLIYADSLMSLQESIEDALKDVEDLTKKENLIITDFKAAVGDMRNFIVNTLYPDFKANKPLPKYRVINYPDKLVPIIDYVKRLPDFKDIPNHKKTEVKDYLLNVSLTLASNTNSANKKNIATHQMFYREK